MFETVLKLIKEYDRIVIHRHTNPDGDAIGAQVGLCTLIRDNFPDKTVKIVGDAPGRYAFIDGSEPDLVPDTFYQDALAIVLDLSSANIVSDERWKNAKKTLRIDHHIFLEKFCDEEIVDQGYESCSGMIADFAKESGLKLSVRSAKAMFTGIVTDSGRFRYDSVSSRTFAAASFLTTVPFAANDIYSNLYSDDFANVLLRAKFILKIRFTDKKTAYIYTTKEELEELKADPFRISRGMVSTMAELKGVKIWANFTEASDGIWCEIRSSEYNINPVAVKYGGGGHAKASGATLKDKNEAFKLLADLDALQQ